MGAGLGYGVPGADALNEIRAQYSGFFLALAIACRLAVFGVLRAQTVLAMLIVTFGGILAGRLIGVAFDGAAAGYGATIRALFIIDAVGLAAAIGALVSVLPQRIE